MQFLAWDQKARNHVHGYPPSYTGNQIVAHEFDHTKENQLVFQAGNVSVYSNPAFHFDTPGPVSLRLEWQGLTITYSGTTCFESLACRSNAKKVAALRTACFGNTALAARVLVLICFKQSYAGHCCIWSVQSLAV